MTFYQMLFIKQKLNNVPYLFQAESVLSLAYT